MYLSGGGCAGDEASVAFKYSLKMLPIATRSISTQFSVI